MFKSKSLTIPEFYKDKSIFLTGVTGFVGKVVVEKLLRSCPDIKNVYVLIRHKKSLKAEERLEKLKQDCIFDVLKETNPKALNKIIPIAGDVEQLHLGISDEDRLIIIKNVSIVFNIAASVRFDDFLDTAIITNVRSTREIIELVGQLNTVDVFAHISTAYSNCDKNIIEEKCYPPKLNWREAIIVAESSNKDKINYLTEKCIEPMPNTYVFTKGLAENVVKDLCENKIPAIILRPSIVLPVIKEPVEAYIDNFNGPVGISLAVGTGIAKVILSDEDVPLDHVFVDNVAKAIITATWKRGTQKSAGNIEIYNLTSDLISSFKRLNNIGSAVITSNPMKYYVGVIKTTLTDSAFIYFIFNLLFHLIPSLILDILLVIAGQKIRILKIRRRLVIANIALCPFTKPSNKIGWTFIHKNYLELEDILSDSDKLNFSFVRARSNEDVHKMMAVIYHKGRKFLIKGERDEASDAEKLRYNRFILADKIIKNAFFAYLIYLVFWKFNLICVLTQRMITYFENVDSYKIY